MKNIIVLVILAGLAWFGYGKFKAGDHSGSGDAGPSPVEHAAGAEPSEVAAASPYQCDGRTRCPQMTSCAEATYFIQHCPNTRMDGNNDGVPCERQWCH